MCNTLLNLAQSPAITNMLVARICLYVRQKKKNNHDMDSTVTGLWGFDIYTT